MKSLSGRADGRERGGMGDERVDYVLHGRRASPSEREGAVDSTMKERARAKNGGSARMDGAPMVCAPRVGSYGTGSARRTTAERSTAT